ncbi:MAG: Two-component sensor PilS [Labilithrix sp.]|nr:Two-component sensor PilS [Labilithrix sp.]
MGPTHSAPKASLFPAAPDVGLEVDPRLAGRLAWITGLRLGFLTLLLVATAFFYLRGELSVYPNSQTILVATIGAAYALAAIYATLLRSGRHLTRLAEVQIVLDQLTWTLLVYVSGGATSGATSFYGLTCLVGAILVGLRGAAIAAVSGITVYVFLCVAFALGWVHPPHDQTAANYVVEWGGMFYPLAVNALGIVVVALLAGYLAERLRRTGGALAVANERAASAERMAMLGTIAAGLAHEIRNPLGSISGSIEMLREAPGLSDEDRFLCDIVQREAARLNNLVSDMLDLSGPRRPVPADVDVASLAREVVQLASRSERSGSGDVTVTYEGPATPVLARCDAGQIRQVLWNLVRNGVQATPAGTRVTVAVRVAAAQVEMEVSDEGPGISEEAAGQIFDAFYTTRTHGAGIGLAVVRRIIDDHAPFGASITVRSAAAAALGRGASFIVRLARVHAPARTQPDPDQGARVTVDENERSRSPDRRNRVES